MKWKRFSADVCFLNPSDVPPAVEALAAVDCEFEYNPDAFDGCGPAVFGMVTGTTELDSSGLHDWLKSILDPFNGDISEWGIGARHA
jgi:hypothetical protein